MNKDYLREIRRKEYRVCSNKKKNGNVTFLGYATRIELMVSYSLLNKFKDTYNNIVYEGNSYYMANKIEKISNNFYKIILISKDLKKKTTIEKKGNNCKSKIEMDNNSITSAVTNGKQESKLIQTQKEDGMHFIHEQYENGKLIFRKEYILKF